MVPSKRRDPYPRILVQGLVLALILSTTNSQWLSYRNSRNAKSKMWFPNMPARAMQQRSSIGSTIRGLESTSSNSGSGISNSKININTNNNNNSPPESRSRTRPINHRSVGQPSYQTVHGGVISKQESVNVQPRTTYQSSSLLQSHNPIRQFERNYASSTRLLNAQSSSNSNQHGFHQNNPNQQQRSHSQSSQNTNQQSNKNSQFSQRSGQQQSWMNNHHDQNPQRQGNPQVVASRHLSININNNQPTKNKVNWQVGGASSGGANQSPSGYTSSKRLLEVGRSGYADPTRRPISQVAGALQDSWPNSNVHHHLQPMLKNQKINNRPENGNNYYEATHEQGSPWGSQVRVSDQAIEIKNFAKSKASQEQKPSYADNPVDRQLSLSGSNGRDKLVSNTLNTLAKLSPKKPIYVYMRAEGIAAVSSGADAGEVIKKLAGSSKLPFYNSTKSLPKENMPTVFLAPEDMEPPGGYGKIPIPNLKQKETTPKPTYTKILLPGGTRMTSHLSNQPHTTTTTPAPIFSQSTSPSFLHSAIQSAHFGYNNSQSPISTDGLSLEQKLKILQMLKGQAEAAMQKEENIKEISNPNGRYQIVHGPPPASETQDGYRDMFRGVLPQGAILDSISTLGGGGQENHRNPGNINSFSQYPVPDQTSNSLAGGQHNPGPTALPNLKGTVGETDIQKLIGAIVETAVSKTVGQMLPSIQQQDQQQNPGLSQQFPPQFPHQHQLNHPQQNFQFQQSHHTHQNLFGQQNQMQQQQHGKIQFPIANGHQMHVVQSPMFMAQSKMGSGPTVFVDTRPSPSPPPQQQQHPSQRPRPPPSSPKPPRINPIKNALSFFGIQSTPRPDHNGRTASPTQMPTLRPFSSLFQHGKHRPGSHNGPPSPNRMPPSPPPHHQPPPYLRRDDQDNSGSNESNEPEKKKGQTIIVQTPDRSKPNGQKSTFVITGGGGDLPELKKIMKVLNELNAESDKTNNSPSESPLSPNQPTGAPFQSQTSPQPSRPPFLTPTPSPAPQQQPTMFPFNLGRPGSLQQQPQVMIRHPSGSPTPGPIIVNTGRPNGIQFVSSTFQPNGQSTPRPIFVSSTGAPIAIGNKNPSQMQIIKAISMPQPIVKQSTSKQNQPQQSGKPLNQQSPQFIFAANPSPQTKVVTTNNNKNSNSAAQLLSSPAGHPKIIEVDPTATKEQIHNSIMQSIMKHQQSKNGIGATTGPIVIKTLPSGGSPFNFSASQFFKVQPSPNTLAPTAKTSAPSSKSARPSKGSSFTVQPAIEITPSSTPQPKKNITPKINTIHQDSRYSKESSDRSSNRKPSSEENSRQQYSKETVEVERQKQHSHHNSREKLRGHYHGSKEVHHHSKEVSDEKPYKNKYKSGESDEKIRKKEQSSEEKVIEKVITEEKIVWNPGPGDGEMIPSRIKTEERIILRPHGVKSSSSENAMKHEANRRISSSEVTLISSAEHMNLKSSENDRKSETDGYFKNPFGVMLVNRGKPNQDTTDENSSKFEDKSANAPSNFAGLLRSKLKFEKMKQHLYPTKQSKTPFKVPESNNPFSQYLHPTSTSQKATSTSAVTMLTSLSPEPTLESTSQGDINGRFKIRPGDISTNKVDGLSSLSSIYGVSPSGNPILLPTSPTYIASPSPSAFPTAVGSSGYPFYGPSPSPQGPTQSTLGSSSSPQSLNQSSQGPSTSPYGPSPSPFGPSPSPYLPIQPLQGPSPSPYGPNIGPSSQSYLQSSSNPSVPFIGANPTRASETYTIPPGTKDEKLLFIPADSIGKQNEHMNVPGPTIQTRNGQNQTVVFTTMNNLPDLMAQLSGTKTEVRMIDDMKTWQETLDRVQATQATSTSTVPPTITSTSTTPLTTTTQQSTTPTPTPGNRRMDGEIIDDMPMTWRPNGTVPVPTIESLRKRFPTGLGANVLHAVSAGFSANHQIQPKWTQNNNGFMNGNAQQQVIYTMSNGVPVAINTGMPITNYQPFLLQGTKEPLLASYYGYNWNTGPDPNPVPSSLKPIEAVEPADPSVEPKYTSRFRGSPPAEIESDIPVMGPIFKIRKHKTNAKPSTTTRDPIDPLSEEYDELTEEANRYKVEDKHISKKNKPYRKGQSNEFEEPSKSSRRRRPGLSRDDTTTDEQDYANENGSKKVSKDENKKFDSVSLNNGRVEEILNSSEKNKNVKSSNKQTYKKINPTTLTLSTSKTVDSVTPDVLSRRIDESDEELEFEDKNKPLKVHNDMFFISGEERRETTQSKLSEEVTPTAKLAILLAPSIITSKSVVKKTGSNYSDNGELKNPPSPKTTVEPSSTTTNKLLTTLLSKITAASTKVTPTVSQTSKDDDKDFRETQAELKSLLKKIQEKLSGKGEVYDLGDDAVYEDYYEELQVPSTKATTTTTTTKGTKKPKAKKSKTKSKHSKSKKSKSSKKSKKSKKSSKKSKTTTKKPIITTEQTTTTTTTKTTPEPIVTNPTTTPTTTTTNTSPSSTKLPQIFNHHRHPVSSLESFTSTSTTLTTPSTTATDDAPLPTHTSIEAVGENSSVEPQQYQYPPQYGYSGSVEIPTDIPAQDASSVSFVYPQSARPNPKDRAAARIHHRKRPLWVRRKGASGSVESLEPMGQPGGANGKVIRLVRRRKPGVRRRPVFVQQSIEIDQTSSSTTPVPVTEESSTPSSSTTSFPGIDSLFENNNELNRRVGFPDSLERSQRNGTLKIGGKRKLKLIRLKGQRAQWRLKMNEQDSSSGDEIEPQAAQLISAPSSLNSQSTLPLVSPLAISPEISSAGRVPAEEPERESRQDPSVGMSLNSVEAKVCIRGKCEMISK